MTEREVIVDALEAQQLDLVDAIPLAAPGPSVVGGARRRRRGEAASPLAGAGEVDISVPLGPDHSAVVLVERDGVYEWNIASAEGPAPLAPAGGQRRRRRGPDETTGAPEPTHSARFTIAIPPATPAGAPQCRRTRGGLLEIPGAGSVIAYVFRFVARPMLGSVARFLERNVREELVHVTSPDPLTWTTLAPEAPLSLPKGRAACVLLLVHGTFSSTVGSFGALASHSAGRAFLEAALRDYDLVIGWDHRTLSVLPIDNAVDLAARLERLGFTEAPKVDAIAFSRGGLVLRSLIEHVLPSSTVKLDVRRAAFVACTNGGTELARPANWHRFVDRYTNLAAAGARAAALVPGFTASATMLAEAIRGLGVFVKVLASSAVTDGAVPGISAMDPGGTFVRDINSAQFGQPAPEQTYYCAVTSNFDPDTAKPQSDPRVMPPALLLKLADKAADSLAGLPNDLVVHVASMTQIDEGIGAYVRERFEFGTNGSVHHCGYFAQPDTALWLGRWFEVLASETGTKIGEDVGSAGGRERAIIRAGSARGVTPAAQVVTLRSTLSVLDAIRRLEGSAEPWIVIERPWTENGKPVTLHYAHRAQAGRAWLERWRSQPGATVHDAFELRETRRSREAKVSSGAASMRLAPGDSMEILNGPHGSHYRTVLMRRGQAVDVLPAEGEAALGETTLLGPSSAQPSVGVSPALGAPRRRFRGLKTASPKKAARGAGSTRGGAVAPVARAVPGQADTGVVACNFRAETDDEYVLQQVHTVAVTVAREALQATSGRASARGTATVKAARPLIVECMPMLRVKLVDPGDARVEIPVPATGTPAEIRFDVVGQEVGPAEVQVQVRQGPLPLVTLTLTMAVVAARSGTRRPVRAVADLDEFPEMPRATDELRIVQMRPTGTATQYRFELRLPSQRVQKCFESAVLDTDPASYVADLYARIEDRWAEHKSEREAFARDLRAIGADLFDSLLPLELRQLLWTHRDDIKSVQVLSSEPFIPWELVHLRDPASRKPGPGSAFLGEIGVVRWLVSGYPPERLRLRRGRARYVVPDYPPPDDLPQSRKEIALVKGFGATEVTPEAETIYSLLEAPGQFDLLHIACHGAADPQDIGSARLEMPGKPRSDGSMSEEHLLATTVQRESQLEDGEFQPIVVLNACQSARAGYSLKGVGGFAQAFVEGGAGVFVGSSWSVGDVPAYAFIEEFYKRFLDPKKPVSLARASAAARQKVRDDGDATWLAYVVYGHPRARVQVE